MRAISITAFLPFLLLGGTTVLAQGTYGDCTYQCEYDHTRQVDGCKGDETGEDIEKCLCQPLIDSKGFQDCAAKCPKDDREYFADGYGPWCSKNMYDDSKASDDPDTTSSATSSTSQPTSTESSAAEESTGAATIEYGRPGLAVAGSFLAFLLV